MKKNNGQVLVAFLLLLPLLFLIITSLLEFGTLSIQKRKITNTVDEVLTYASKNKTSDALEEEVTTLLNKNIEGIHILQTIKEKEYFEIRLTIELKGIFKGIFKEKYMYTVEKRKTYR